MISHPLPEFLPLIILQVTLRYFFNLQFYILTLNLLKSNVKCYKEEYINNCTLPELYFATYVLV